MAKEKVLVGMSGGVDSSVAAAILLEQGYEVAGVTLKLHSYNSGSEQDICDARSVCEKLGIPHFVFDLSKDFKERVVNSFVNEYISGRTPNPCIVCNKYIKFGKMLEKAQEMGFDKIATGHYSRTENQNGRWLLYRCSDKDQSYVLYSLTQYQLSKTLFPLGKLSKEQVRKKAQDLGFVNADKPDSQDICFVCDGDYAEFIEEITGKISEKGSFVDRSGNILGEHNGIIRYTVGQRKGLGIALGKPAFVLEKNLQNNQIVLGDEPELFYKTVKLKDVNFISFDDIAVPLRVTAKLRYRHTEQPALIVKKAENEYELCFYEPQRAPSPGQAAVFYNGDEVIGGGTII